MEEKIEMTFQSNEEHKMQAVRWTQSAIGAVRAGRKDDATTDFKKALAEIRKITSEIQYPSIGYDIGIDIAQMIGNSISANTAKLQLEAFSEMLAMLEQETGAGLPDLKDIIMAANDFIHNTVKECKKAVTAADAVLNYHYPQSAGGPTSGCDFSDLETRIGVLKERLGFTEDKQ